MLLLYHCTQTDRVVEKKSDALEILTLTLTLSFFALPSSDSVSSALVEIQTVCDNKRCEHAQDIIIATHNDTIGHNRKKGRWDEVWSVWSLEWG